jgi:hypothetical protein
VIYLTRAANARPKSLKQLLTTLTNALRKSQGGEHLTRKRAIIGSLLSGLTNYAESHKAKPCAQLLGNLLNRQVVSIQELLDAYREQRGPEFLADQRTIFQDLLRDLFRWLSDGEFGATVAQFATTLLSAYEAAAVELDSLSSEVLWSGPLIDALQRGTIKIDDLKAHTLPVLFKRKFSDFVLFLETHGFKKLLNATSAVERGAPSMDDEEEDSLLYAALQAGKEIGFLYEAEKNDAEQTQTALLIPVDVLGRLLARSSRSARLTGLTCLITSHAATRPFSTSALKLIKRNLGNLFADADADFRSVVFGMFQRLVDRSRAITAVLSRQTSQKMLDPKVRVSSSEVLQYHHEFLQWLVVFLTRDLRPTASYQRHISALKCLSILVRSGIDKSIPTEHLSKGALGETKWPISMTIFSKDLRRRLLDILMDPFEDVRQTASSILHLHCVMQADEDFLREVGSTLSSAEKVMLLTGRADHADGVAHLYGLKASCGKHSPSQGSAGLTTEPAVLKDLMKQIEAMLSVAQRDLAQAVAKYPLHGILTSLRYVLVQSSTREMTEPCTKIFDLLCLVWDVVKPILCNDAPEGYLPEDFEESSDSSKETLSYCWRALKEASLLMGTIMSHVEDHSVSERIAQLCFAQLAELRHRGAFSTVAQTWASICIRYGACESSNGVIMLEKWYKDILNMLRTNITINTRRSAGLPSLLCGVLIADSSKSYVHRAFEELRCIAETTIVATANEEASLAQVHAMNCIKDIMKNTRLGEHSERHIPATMQLAATALQSDIWAIRNCGLMLFRAVIDRLLGTSEAHLDDSTELVKQISLAEQPEVLNVLIDILTNATNGDNHNSSRYEGVFPSLQLVQQARIPRDARNKIKDAVVILTASPRWHVRDKAARTYASLVELSDATLEAAVIIQTGNGSHNALHGRLLAARYIMAQLSVAVRTESAKSLNTSSSIKHGSCWDLDELYALASHSYQTVTCNALKAASIDLLRELLLVSVAMDRDIATVDLPDYAAFIKGIDVAGSLASERLRGSPSAGVRQALARFAAVQICRTAVETSALFHALIDLATDDPNAMVYFLDEVRASLDDRDFRNSPRIVEICFRLLAKPNSTNLRCAAQGVLLHAYFQAKDTTPLEAFSLTDFEPIPPTQRFADNELELRAMRFNIADDDSSRVQIGRSDEIRLLAADCTRAVAGGGLHSREAAAFSLQRAGELWRALHADHSLDAEYRNLCIAVYDLLNDDDEDIRIVAASIATQMLSNVDVENHREPDLEPITASQRLLSFVVRRWSGSKDLFGQAFTRLFGKFEPVDEQISRYIQTDQALFAEEKQNLYIDDAREVAVWAQMAMKLSWPEAVDQTLVKHLGTWVENGIPSLRSHGTSLMSKAETFTLGLSVIYGAEILLRLSASGMSPIRPSDLRATLISWISELDKAGDAGTWRSELERVLQQSLRLKLGNLNTVLEDVLAQQGPGV